MHKTKQQVQKGTSSKEFNDWNYYLDEIWPNEFNPIHHYLALIAADVSRTVSKNPKKIKIEDKILKFRIVRKEKKQTAATKEEAAEKISASKQMWFSAVGLNSSGQKKKEETRKPITRRIPNRKK